MSPTGLLLLGLTLQSVPPPPPGAHPGQNHFDFRPQAQALVLGGLALPDGGEAIAGELQLNGSIFGFGAALGILFEDQHLDTPGRERVQVASLHFGLQYRFVAQLSRSVYPYFDPHLDIGFLLGGGAKDDEPVFRGAAFVGAGIDVPLQFSRIPQVVATVQYRYMAGQTPEEMQSHVLMIGLGLRMSGDLEKKPAPAVPAQPDRSADP